MRLSDLSCKQVIDMKTGKMIGKIADLCFMEADYVIKEFYVAPPSSCLKRLFPFLFPNEEITIRVCDIVQIGEDVVIVRVT
ncbi:MAG: sporulation protein [Erysipelotrichaceae bacterium]|nr:sporulation protein [Erysipelotrichaceae bacterium]